MPKSDSSIRAEGAEIYVQALLMLEFGIITSRASRNMPGYDVIAYNLKKKKDCRISVKYRKAANSHGFRFSHLNEFDYFVGIIGQRGKIGKADLDDQILQPLSEIYVLTRQEVRKAVKRDGEQWLLPTNKDVLKPTRKDAWKRILKHLKIVK